MDKKPTLMTIRDCEFVGVKYDAAAIAAIDNIALGLIENARALGALATVLKASNVTIETMVKLP